MMKTIELEMIAKKLGYNTSIMDERVFVTRGLMTNKTIFNPMVIADQLFEIMDQFAWIGLENVDRNTWVAEVRVNLQDDDLIGALSTTSRKDAILKIALIMIELE